MILCIIILWKIKMFSSACMWRLYVAIVYSFFCFCILFIYFYDFRFSTLQRAFSQLRLVCMLLPETLKSWTTRWSFCSYFLSCWHLIFYFYALFLSGIPCQEHVSINHSARKDPTRRDAAGLGKKDSGKTAKRNGTLFSSLSCVFSMMDL